MSEAGDFPDDPTPVPRMMAFHDEMAKAGVLLDGARCSPAAGASESSTTRPARLTCPHPLYQQFGRSQR